MPAGNRTAEPAGNGRATTGVSWMNSTVKANGRQEQQWLRALLPAAAAVAACARLVAAVALSTLLVAPLLRLLAPDLVRGAPRPELHYIFSP